MKLFALIFALAVLLTGCAPKTEVPKANAVNAASPQASATANSAVPSNSTYTGLDEKACKDMKPGAEDQGAIHKAECPSAGGYKVILLASDHSVELTFVDPAGKSTDLGIPHIVNSAGGFVLGQKIEWRSGANGAPTAFIVRANKFTDPEDQNKQESSLLVGKMGETTCITDVVGPSTADQNTRARELADTAKDRPCVPTVR
jgi:hypothetical protein